MRAGKRSDLHNRILLKGIGNQFASCRCQILLEVGFNKKMKAGGTTFGRMKRAFLFFFCLSASSAFSRDNLPGPADSTGKQKKSTFRSLALSWADRAGDFEENLFKDPQLLVNASVIHSRYDLSSYFTDEWLLQENDLELTGNPDLMDPLRKYNLTRLSLEVTGSFLFFYGGAGMVLPSSAREIDMGKGRTWYYLEDTRYTGLINKGSYWKGGLNFHFRRWCFSGGLRGYNGINQSGIRSKNLKTGEVRMLTGVGSKVFSNFLEIGIRYQNFTFGFEKALNIDFAGPESTSFFIGYNLFDLRNFNEKRIPR